MQAPPPYVYPQKKNNNTVLIVILVVLGLFAVCCGGLVFLGFQMWGKIRNVASCQVHFVEVYRAINRYANDKKHYPPADTWQDAITPYWKIDTGNSEKARAARQIIDMGDPSKNLGCPAGEGPETGMAYNKELSNLPTTKVKSDTTVLIFEVSSTLRNQSEAYKARTEKSPQTIFGQPRPWIVYTVTGQSASSMNSDSPFRTTSSSSSDDSDSRPPRDIGKNASN